MRAKSMMLLAGLMLLATGCGEIRNPFSGPPAVVDTPVPGDFAVAVEEAMATQYARQTTRQVITASDMMSRTTYTYYRDFNNTISTQFTTEHPVNAAQLQAMWNEVQRYKLMQGASTWYYWEGHVDDYRRDERVMEIRVGGKSQTYKQLNHWGYKLRDLALDVQAVRLPITQGGGIVPSTLPAGTGVVTQPASMPWIEIRPATVPATLPAKQP